MLLEVPNHALIQDNDNFLTAAGLLTSMWALSSFYLATLCISTSLFVTTLAPWVRLFIFRNKVDAVYLGCWLMAVLGYHSVIVLIVLVDLNLCMMYYLIGTSSWMLLEVSADTNEVTSWMRPFCTVLMSSIVCPKPISVMSKPAFSV